MQKNLIAGYCIAFGMLGLVFDSCKGKAAQTTTTDTAVVAPTDNIIKKRQDTTVVISVDDSLKTMVTDATKDFPGVTAAVDQGVITLTGSITRDRLPKLMMAINALHPKKVTNNLTIGK